MFTWILKKLIARERKRQIKVYGYTTAHDDKELHSNAYHLLDEASMHYNWGHPIQALALLQAQKEYGQRVYNQLYPIREGEVKLLTDSEIDGETPLN